MDGVQLVTSAILGIDHECAFINGKLYHIQPPTIRRMVGAVHHLKESKGETVQDIIINADLEGACKALSWFIEGNESLYETFLDAPVGEVQEGLIKALSMLDPENFIRLSALQKSVRRLIARPK